MPNRTGGKNYKKSKQTGSIEKPFIDRQEDQQYGRVLRNLGGRNMLIYCNDNKIRLCHICGAMKKFNWLSVGDIVLISLRDFGKKPEPGSTDKYEKGDILAKYDSDHLGKLKKMPDANPKLFMQLETMDGKILAEIGDREASAMKLPGHQEDDVGIEFDRDGDEEEEEGSGDDSDEEKRKGKGNKPVKNSKAAAATQKDKESAEDDTFNIDDI
jgi:translation initiation factor 1A